MKKGCYINNIADAEVMVLLKAKEHLSRTEEPTYDERAGIALSSWFSLRSASVIIEGDIFRELIEKLLQSRVLNGVEPIFEEYPLEMEIENNIEEIAQERGSSIQVFCREGIILGQKFPDAPPKEILWTTLAFIDDIDSEKLSIMLSRANEAATINKYNLNAEETLFEVEFRRREITINGIPLSKPDFGRENHKIFDYFINNPNREVTRQEIEAYEKYPKGRKMKPLNNAVRDLGFKKDLKKLFFYDCTSDSALFLNPITSAHLNSPELSHLKTVNIEKIVREIKPRNKVK